MNRMNNGRLAGNPNDLGVDFEPSCLVRTPSGNVYIPSGNLSKYLFIFILTLSLIWKLRDTMVFQNLLRM